MTHPGLIALVGSASSMPFSVFVGLLEQLMPDRATPGGQGPVSAELVRFRHDPSLAFPPGDVAKASLVTPSDGPPYVELITTFAGLTGCVSPLAPSLIEDLARGDDDTRVQRDFLDIFHHRLLALLYRGLAALDAPLAFRDDLSDPSSQSLLSWSGLLPERARHMTGLEPACLLRFSPLLTTYPPGAERLRIALRDVVGDLLSDAQIRVDALTGGLVRLDDAERPRLGSDMRLGWNSALGPRVGAPQSRICLAIGPLSAEACAQLSPGGERLPVLLAVVRLLLPDTVELEVNLQPARAPALCLGRRAPGALPQGSRELPPSGSVFRDDSAQVSSALGRNTWLPGRGQPAPLRFRPSLTPP